MPEEWKITLQNSSITLKEQQQNPQAVIAALGFYHNHNTTSKYMYQSEKSKSTRLQPNQLFNLVYLVSFEILTTTKIKQIFSKRT